MQWATKTQKGFTIVELLIVVVVIAILAAITIVAYNGVAQRAKAATAQSAAQQAAKKLATYAIDNGDTYPPNLTSLGLVNTESTTYQYSVNTSTTPQGYCVTATTKGVSYNIGSNYSYTGSSSGTVNQPSPIEGVCPGHSATGSSVVNLVANPSAEVAQAGYGRPGGSGLTLSTVRAQNGASSAIVTLPANAPPSTTGMLFHTEAPLSSIKPNTSYVASAYVYVPSSTGRVRLSIQGSGLAAGSDNNLPHTIVQTSMRDQWVRVYNAFTTNASGDVYFYILNVDTTTSSGTTQFWADAFMLTEGTKNDYVYADGNSPGWVWNGTPGLSSSTGPAL